jgi:hypothetical protein
MLGFVVKLIFIPINQVSALPAGLPACPPSRSQPLNRNCVQLLRRSSSPTRPLPPRDRRASSSGGAPPPCSVLEELIERRPFTFTLCFYITMQPLP